MRSNYHRITLICLVVMLSMLIATACQSRSVSTSNLPLNSGNDDGESAELIVPENDFTSDATPNVEISFAKYQQGNQYEGMYTVDNGWANYQGLLGFYNQDNSAVTLEINDDFESEARVVIDTKEGNQYEGTILIIAVDGDQLYKGYRSTTAYIPQKTATLVFPKISSDPMFSFMIEFKIPELLHLTKITISNAFSLPDGTSDFIINKFYENYSDWGAQYPLKTTGDLPETIKFSDGVEMQIESQWENIDIIRSETYPTICLKTNITNTDITGDANFSDKEFLLIASIDRGSPNAGGAIFLITIYNTDGSLFDDGFQHLGPGQQRNTLLCIDHQYSDPYKIQNGELNMKDFLSVYLNPSIPSRIRLSVSGEGVDELLNVPRN